MSQRQGNQIPRSRSRTEPISPISTQQRNGSIQSRLERQRSPHAISTRGNSPSKPATVDDVITYLNQYVDNGFPLELLARLLDEFERWDQLSQLLSLVDRKLRGIIYQVVRSIDFVGSDLITDYRETNDYSTGDPFVSLLNPDENWQDIISHFPKLTQYRIALNQPTLQEVQVLFADTRARWVQLQREFDSDLIRWLWEAGIVEGLRVRSVKWKTQFTLITLGFYYSDGMIYLPNDAFFTRWNRALTDDDIQRVPELYEGRSLFNLVVSDFLAYDTYVMSQFPYISHGSHLGYLESICRASTISMTTLVLLQESEIFHLYGPLIEFAGSVAGIDHTDYRRYGIAQKRSSQPTNFPIIKYLNDWIDPFAQQIQIRRGHKVDLFEQAERLMDAVLAQRANLNQDAVRNLPNITVYEVPILEEDLETATALFPSVRWFNVYDFEGQLNRVER